MSKRTHFTTVTPLPAGISRETVLSTLHSHTEMIDLNPLVTERHPIRPPPCATPEESQCQWYSVTDRISYLPAGLYTGSLTFMSCFHDLEDGLQTRVVAPMGLDMRGRWTLGGSLPGEVLKKQELNLGMPKSGLWLREDVDMKVNVMMTSFVKKTTKKAHSTLVDRLIEKSHLKEAEGYNNVITEQLRLRESYPPDYHAGILSPTGSTNTSLPATSSVGYGRESQYSYNTGDDGSSLYGRPASTSNAPTHATYPHSGYSSNTTATTPPPQHYSGAAPPGSPYQRPPSHSNPSTEYPPDHKYTYQPSDAQQQHQQQQQPQHQYKMVESLYPAPLSFAQQQQHPALQQQQQKQQHPHQPPYPSHDMPSPSLPQYHQAQQSHHQAQQQLHQPCQQQQQQHQQQQLPPLQAPPPVGTAFELPSQDIKTPTELDGPYHHRV